MIIHIETKLSLSPSIEWKECLEPPIGYGVPISHLLGAFSVIRESLFEALKSRLAPPITTTPPSTTTPATTTSLVTTPAAPVSDTLVELKFQVKGDTDANLLLAHCEDCDGFRVRASNEGSRRFHNHREGWLKSPTSEHFHI